MSFALRGALVGVLPHFNARNRQPYRYGEILVWRADLHRADHGDRVVGDAPSLKMSGRVAASNHKFERSLAPRTG